MLLPVPRLAPRIPPQVQKLQPPCINLFIRVELKMADIGNLVSHGEIQFASVRKVLSIQSFHHPAKAFK